MSSDQVIVSNGDLFHAVFEKWLRDGLKPNEPLSEENIVQEFRRVGLEPTKDILEVLTVLNGFDDGTVDDECLQFWALPRIISEYKKGSEMVEFADFLIDSHRYAFAIGVEPIPVYMTYAKFGADRIANSAADFFHRYLNDSNSILYP